MTILYKRNDYLEGNCTHQEYYAQFIVPSTYTFIKERIGMDTLRRSTNIHFNDVIRCIGSSKWIWDYTPIDLDKLRLANDFNSANTRTCVGKAAAKILLNMDKDK